MLFLLPLRRLLLPITSSPEAGRYHHLLRRHNHKNTAIPISIELTQGMVKEEVIVGVVVDEFGSGLGRCYDIMIHMARWTGDVSYIEGR
jgi:hypothetical protein